MLIENNMNEMIDNIKEIITPNEQKGYSRSSLRIGFKYHEYSLIINYKGKDIKGYIKDLSLKGIGIEITDINDFKHLQVGSFISINIDFELLHLNIIRGIIVRKDNRKKVIGIKINITDNYEIDKENKIIFENIIKTRITKVAQSNYLNINNPELIF